MATPRFDDPDHFVLARRHKEAPVRIPGDGKDHVGMDVVDLVQYASISCIPNHALHKFEGKNFIIIIIIN